MDSDTTPATSGRMPLLKRAFAARPWWMNACMVFCAYMAIAYMPYDVFVKPVARDQEVWLGYMLTGWAAKATEPLHWAIYAAGTWGFYRMRAWMWPWASLYVAQIFVGMVVWSALYAPAPAGPWGLAAALATLGVLGALAIGLWRARPRFQAGPHPT